MDDQQGSLRLIPVPHSNYHYVNSQGDVFSLRFNKMKKLKTRKHYGRGKKKFYLRVKFGKTNELVHRVVASVLVGRKLFTTEVFNHKDGNTANNALSNLEVVTHKQNCEHAVANSLYCSGVDWHNARV